MRGNKMMNRTIIERQYIRFCEKLYEIADKYDYVIFISRKCYYYTQVILDKMRKDGKDIDLPVTVLRDRDLSKIMDFSIFKNGKKILLVDDTVYTGKTLLKVLDRFDNEKVDAKGIEIVTFALHPDAVNAFLKSEHFAIYKKMFQELFDYSQMAEFITLELQTIQESLYSYVIDLPIFVEKEISAEKFDQMIVEKKSAWIFSKYKVKVKDKTYENGFFVYGNSYLKSRLNPLLIELVVKCRYERKKNKDGKETVICRFTPFAILRSVEYEIMWELFKALFKDSDYFKVLGKLNGGKNELAVTIYRAVVYCLSYFTGIVFQNYIKNIIDVHLELDKNLSKAEINDSFSKAINRIFNEFSVSSFYNRLPELPYESIVEYNSGEKSLPDDFHKMQEWFTGWIAVKKNESLLKTETEEITEKYVTFEEVEQSLKEYFVFDNQSQFYKCLISILLKALDTGIISNGVAMIDDKMILRYFKLGESSDILLEYDMTVFYAAIYSYYNCLNMSAKKYKESYVSFTNALRNFLMSEKYFDNMYITVEAFEYYSDYFDMDISILKREITNKRYILADNLNTERRYVRDIIDFAYDFVNG